MPIYTTLFLGYGSSSLIWLLPLLASLKVICSCKVAVSFFFQTSPSLTPLAYSNGFPGGSVVENLLPAMQESTKDPVLIPELGRSPGEGNGYQLQYSCQENHMDRGAWQATVHVVAESDMSDWHTRATTLQFFFKANEVNLSIIIALVIEVHHLLRTHLSECHFRGGSLSPELKPCPSTIKATGLWPELIKLSPFSFPCGYYHTFLPSVVPFQWLGKMGLRKSMPGKEEEMGLSSGYAELAPTGSWDIRHAFLPTIM